MNLAATRNTRRHVQELKDYKGPVALEKEFMQTRRQLRAKGLRDVGASTVAPKDTDRGRGPATAATPASYTQTVSRKFHKYRHSGTYVRLHVVTAAAGVVSWLAVVVTEHPCQRCRRRASLMDPACLRGLAVWRRTRWRAVASSPRSTPTPTTLPVSTSCVFATCPNKHCHVLPFAVSSCHSARQQAAAEGCAAELGFTTLRCKCQHIVGEPKGQHSTALSVARTHINRAAMACWKLTREGVGCQLQIEWKPDNKEGCVRRHSDTRRSGVVIACTRSG